MIENRLRWDFRTGLYYYSLKPAEARALGHVTPDEVSEVRLFWLGCDMANVTMHTCTKCDRYPYRIVKIILDRLSWEGVPSQVKSQACTGTNTKVRRHDNRNQSQE